VSQFELICADTAFPLLKVTLAPGQSCHSESGAMVQQDVQIEIKGKAVGGFKKSLARSLFGGESFFQVVATNASNIPASICFAPKTPGAIAILQLGAKGYPDLNMGDGAFLASSANVVLGNRSQGLGKGLFGSGGFFVLHAAVDTAAPAGSSGTVALNCFGAMTKISLAQGQQTIVDNGHLIAWTCTYEVKKAASGLFSTMKTGEGFVLLMTGPGDVFIQTRNIEELAHSILPYIPQRNN
jgi:uncharacterized protein (TIGR00266 family)